MTTYIRWDRDRNKRSLWFGEGGKALDLTASQMRDIFDITRGRRLTEVRSTPKSYRLCYEAPDGHRSYCYLRINLNGEVKVGWFWNPEESDRKIADFYPGSLRFYLGDEPTNYGVRYDLCVHVTGRDILHFVSTPVQDILTTVLARRSLTI